MDDKKVIACNINKPTKTASKGALAYMASTSGGAIGCGRINLLIRSRGGRWIEKWEAIKRLDNFRFKTLPAGHPLYNDERITDYATEETLNHILRVKEEITCNPS